MNEEVFILSQTVPTWVCNSPANAVVAAAHAGATVILLNERSEHCDNMANFSIILVDKHVDNNVHTVNLLAKSDAIVTLFKDNIQELTSVYRHAFLATWEIMPNDLADTKVIGFTGLHDSGAFYYHLLMSGYNVKGFIPLPHLQRQEKQLQTILQMAADSKSVLVTSDKDAPFLSKKMRRQVRVLPLRLKIDPRFFDMIEQAIIPRETISSKGSAAR
jgi:tetraacyldisaccharide-1-P 4'-kinase